ADTLGAQRTVRVMTGALGSPSPVRTTLGRPAGRWSRSATVSWNDGARTSPRAWTRLAPSLRENAGRSPGETLERIIADYTRSAHDDACLLAIQVN
ncbi:hypothetical protein ACFQ6Q_34840, partial [Streptomyces sp. NPDC056437]|uniref:hypothetical protein n=1 Tax=Streptomyces sp. NPDC056437 TaxID=3345816 RepID=UPI0036CC352F